jgi:hypothetical protein
MNSGGEMEEIEREGESKIESKVIISNSEQVFG